MSKSLGQNVIVDNRAGAGGNLGIGMVARANPDGYTLLLSSTAIAVNPGLFSNLRLRSVQGLPADLGAGQCAQRLFVHPDSGIMTIADLVARQGLPGHLQLFAPGVGTKSHLTGEQIKLRASVTCSTCRIGAAGPATPALWRAPCSSARSRWRPVESLIQAGPLRALAAPAPIAGSRCRRFRP